MTLIHLFAIGYFYFCPSKDYRYFTERFPTSDWKTYILFTINGKIEYSWIKYIKMLPQLYFWDVIHWMCRRDYWNSEEAYEQDSICKYCNLHWHCLSVICSSCFQWWPHHERSTPSEKTEGCLAWYLHLLVSTWCRYNIESSDTVTSVYF